MQKNVQRGMTIIELVISFGVLMLVLGLSTAMFHQAFTHATLTNENLDNEQLARIAMARVNSSLSQASVDSNSNDAVGGTPMPAVLVAVPNNASATSITFFRVKTLVPASIPTNSTLAPNPGYDVHIISWNAGNQTLNEYTMDYATVYAVGGASPSPQVIAKNVTNFGVTQVNGNTREYQVTISVNNLFSNPNEWEKPFTLVDDVDIMN